MEDSHPQSVSSDIPQPSTPITLTGMLIDTITHVGEKIPFPPASVDTQPPDSNSFSSTFPMNWILFGIVDFDDCNVDIHPKYRSILQYPISGQSQVEAFMRMIIMNKDGDGNPPGEDFNGLYFSPWVKQILRIGCAKQEEERLKAGIEEEGLEEEEGQAYENDRFLDDGTEITEEIEEEWARARALFDIGFEERVMVFDEWVMRACAGKMMLRGGRRGFLVLWRGLLRLEMLFVF